MILQAQTKARLLRRWVIYGTTAAFLFVLTIFLLYALRSLILPSIVGALFAYICRPLLGVLKREGLSHGVAIMALFVIFGGVVMGLVWQIEGIIPDEKGKLVLRTRIQYKLDERYNAVLGKDQDKKGNLINQLFGSELQPMMDRINNAIMFDPSERIDFEIYASEEMAKDPMLESYYGYYLKNIQSDQKRLGKAFLKHRAEEKNNTTGVEPGGGKILSAIGDIISLWIAAPFVFLFLLFDEGQIKKNLVYLVPNQYFEMLLTMIDNVDEAIGNYLRGTLVECSLVGVTFVVCLYLIGVQWNFALIIGIIAGLANAIPFLGPAIGLVVGLGYALIAEEATPLIPWVNLDNMVLWVLITVAIAQGLDNAVFQPIVLGSAVSLHPLVVIIGVMGGSILLGFSGMLFAIPAIVVCKVIFVTFFQQMKAYNII